MISLNLKQKFSSHNEKDSVKKRWIHYSLVNNGLHPHFVAPLWTHLQVESNPHLNCFSKFQFLAQVARGTHYMLELKLLFITEASCSRRGDMISDDAHCAPPRSCALPASEQASRDFYSTWLFSFTTTVVAHCTQSHNELFFAQISTKIWATVNEHPEEQHERWDMSVCVKQFSVVFGFSS